MAEIPGKIPPYNSEAEQSILGSVLIDNESLVKVSDMLEPVDFYTPQYGKIYEIMLKMSHDGKPIDLVTLNEYIQKSSKNDNLFESSHLAELTEKVPTSSHIFHYAQIVKKYSTLRKLLRAGQEITALGFEIDDEMTETLEKAEKSLFSVTQNFVVNKLVHIKDILQKRYDEFADLHDHDGEIPKGLQTHYHSLDKILVGIQPTDLVILAARPSMGKTAFAINLALNMTQKDEKKIAMFSLEMSKEQLVDRMFCSAMQLDAYKLHKGELDDEEFARVGDAMDSLSRANVYIDDSVVGQLTEIKSKCRRLQIEKGLDLIVIDYLQLLGSSGNIAFRVQEISDISRGLKNLARELHVPVLALSQLSRAVESRVDKTPQLSDLRESGSIEQDADIVLMMYREFYYDEECQNPEKTDIIVRKNRNGPLGKSSLAFKKEYQKFVNYDYREDVL
jgi:replicative DNA helicase